MPFTHPINTSLSRAATKSGVGSLSDPVSQGRISSYAGVDSPPIVNLVSQQGPISRTVKDTAVLLQVLAGYDSRDTGSLREPTPDFGAALDRNVSGLRIGWTLDYGYTPVEPEVAEISRNATKAFEELGCSVEGASCGNDSFRHLQVFEGNRYTV